MRIHILQHVAFEGSGCILPCLKEKGHIITFTHFFENDYLPGMDAFDGLVIMGGPMGIHDEQHYSWLRKEKTFIRDAVSAGKKIIGICLGAQLLAHVLGAAVYPNTEKEIGWFDVKRSDEKAAGIGRLLPENWTTFHWHGDTFDLPDGARLLAESAVCKHQAFCYQDMVIGLQFHPEMTVEGIEALITNSTDHLQPGPFVQSLKKIKGRSEFYEANHRLMRKILDHLF